MRFITAFTIFSIITASSCTKDTVDILDSLNEQNNDQTETVTETGTEAVTATATATATVTGTETDTTTPIELTNIERALINGDASYLSSDDNVLLELQSEIQAQATFSHDLLQNFDLANAQSVYWNPTHDAALIKPIAGKNIGILNANQNQSDDVFDDEFKLGIAGIESTNNQRYALLGSSPFRNYIRDASALSDDMHAWLNQLLSWLINTDSSAPINIVIAQHDQSYYFPDDEGLRTWLTEQTELTYTANDINTCDGALLLSCLENADLLVISQQNAEQVSDITQALNYANQHSIPVLYTHLDGGLTDTGAVIFDHFDSIYAKDNYWPKRVVSGSLNSSSMTSMQTLPDDIRLINDVLTRFDNNDFTFLLSDCLNTCKDDDTFNEEFLDAANALKSLTSELNKAKQPLFESSDYRLQKLLILLIDQWRQDTRFPMDAASSEQTAFLKSYFTDHGHFILREHNPVQSDLGNFSRSDFSHITPQNKTVSLTSKQPFRASGVYAIPGQVMSVTRTDTSQSDISISINTQRSGSTHEFDENGYSRPKFLQSDSVTIEPGQTIKLTSAYGGPVQINFSDSNTDVSLNFENVGSHPIWRSEADNEQFAADLESNQYDWAELITPAFEVHSQLTKMQESANSELFNSTAQLAQATMTYTHNYPLVLAGFQGEGIDNINEITEFAAEIEYELPIVTTIKHMNADQATCGYGCSGNPYDAYWSFNPVGHGDIHEVGHGLEKSRFRFPNWDGHATTNPYSYYSKSEYYKNTGNAPSCQSLPFTELKALQIEAASAADGNAYMQENGITSWNYGAALYIQFMMSAQAHGDLENGWHLWARLHTIERAFSEAKNSEEQWLLKRAVIGFSQISYEQAQSLENADFMLIAISFAAKLDFEEYFDSWFLGPSDIAKTQVATFGFDNAPLKFYDTTEDQFCLTLTWPEVDLATP